MPVKWRRYIRRVNITTECNGNESEPNDRIWRSDHLRTNRPRTQEFYQRHQQLCCGCVHTTPSTFWICSFTTDRPISPDALHGRIEPFAITFPVQCHNTTGQWRVIHLPPSFTDNSLITTSAHNSIMIQS